MTRKSLLVLIAVATVVAGAGILALPQSSEWTTDSKEALAEFEAAMEASQKLYHQDARSHLERALELDPDFVVAKVRMADFCRYEDEDHATQLMTEAGAADLSRLTARERFMVQRAQLLTDLRFEEAQSQMAAFLERFPDDPYVLHIKALGTWQQGQLIEAERLNKRLLEISPNWVIAYNQLGYITMMQGRFAEAEEYFTSYRFIAPDQANPHDSLGELFIVLGRYDEARDSFEQALIQKPDFVAAFEHLAMVDALREDWDGAELKIERGIQTEGISDETATRFRCAIDFWHLATDREWAEIIKLAEGDCPPEKLSDIGATIHVHHAACRLEKWDMALEIETKVKELIEKGDSKEKSNFRELLIPMAHHMTGVRLSLQEDYEGGIRELELADEHLTYMNAGIGLLKLSNRLALATVLRKAGHEAESHALIGKVRTINPEIVQRYEERGMMANGM
ncbi:MAG: tetratricopeptide repeat protein [Acidobacteriota bacterium]